jgi:hypothetical protein
MILDPKEAEGRVALALKRALGPDAPRFGGYGALKARATAHYASLIAEAWAAGALEERELHAELREIEHMTRRWVKEMRGLPGGAVEQAAQAAVAAIIGAVRGSASLAGAAAPR